MVARSRFSRSVSVWKRSVKRDPQIRFFEDIQQFDHRPACAEFGFEQPQVLGLGLRRQRREGDPAAALGQQAHVRIVGNVLVELL